MPLLLVREDRAVGQAVDVLRDESPWVDLLPAADRSAFVADVVRAVQASAELGNWAVLAQAVTEWMATASVHADPDLRRQLSEPVAADHGLVPDPDDV